MLRHSTLYLAVAALCLACGSSEPTSDAPTNSTEPDLSGSWRAVLDSPGGELPFGLTIEGAAPNWSAYIINGPERVAISRVEAAEGSVTFHFDGYDSQIEAKLSGDGQSTSSQSLTGQSLTGSWTKTVPEGLTVLPFRAQRGTAARFTAAPPADGIPPSGAKPAIAPRWQVEFTDEDGTEPAVGEFAWQGDEILGTFLTPTGDYRYLAGSLEVDRLRLSAFDGAHAFLFDAQLTADGNLLTGDFWSRDTYHATWTARPIAADQAAELPSQWELARNTHPEGKFRFTFPDLDGKTVTSDDPRFADKVVLINIFGSWCPNCNDEAPLLADWHRRYAERGLEVVGLAYEFTGETDRDTEQVRRFGQRHQVDYPLLLAGTSDKKDAAATLPDLDVVIAYPTTVFLGRDGTVRKIHSGFSGPGTGDHFEELKVEMEGFIEELLAEAAG